MRTLFCAIGVLVVAALPTVPSASHAATGTLYNGVSGFAMDVEHERMFVSATVDGAARLLVMSLDGDVITSVDGMADTGQPVLSNDGGTVLVPMPRQDAVAVVDTTTLISRTVHTETGACPSEITETGGGFWVLVGCDPTYTRIARIDLVTGDLTQIDVEGWPDYRPNLLASPALPGTLVVLSGEPTRVDLLSASATGTPSLSVRATRVLDPWGDRPTAAISPDGSRIAVASETKFLDLSSTTLETIAQRSAGRRQLAANIAYRADGWRAEIHYDYTSSYDVYTVVMRRPDGSIFRKFERRKNRYLLNLPHDLVWGPRHLYAIKSGRLHVYEQKLPSRLRIRLDRESYKLGDVAHVRVRLQSDSPSRRVSLYATPYGRDRRLVTSGDVNEDGYLDAQLRLRRNTLLEAAFDGDADNEDVAVVRRTFVQQPIRTWLKGYRRVSGQYAVYRQSDRVKVIAEPLDGQPRDFVCFRVDTGKSTGWTYSYTDCGHLDETLTTSARLRRSLVGDRVRVRAEWEGKRGFTTSLGPWKYYRVVS